MKKKVINWLSILFILLILFHISVIMRFIPFEIVWGGNLKSMEEMYQFEAFSIGIILLMLWILQMKGGRLKRVLPIWLINTFLGLFMLFFLLNTVGNLLAKTDLEKYFAILTLVFSVSFGFILFSKEKLTD